MQNSRSVIRAFGGNGFPVSRTYARGCLRHPWLSGHRIWRNRPLIGRPSRQFGQVGSQRAGLMEPASVALVAAASGSILIREAAMPICETCGNDYDKAF